MQTLNKLAILVVVAAAIGAAIWFVSGRGREATEALVPLGPLVVNLPPVVSGDLSPLVQKHQFRFRSNVQEPLGIASVTASCSCTEATSSNEVVMPGGELVIETVTTLERASSRHATIWVRFDDGRGVKMHITAALRRPVVLSTSPPDPRAEPEQEELEFRLVWAADPAVQEAPEPAIEADRGLIESMFGGWQDSDVPRGVFGPDGPPSGVRAKAGQVRLKRLGERWPVVLTIRMPGADPLELQLRDLNPGE